MVSSITASMMCVGPYQEIGKTLMEEEVEFIESRWEYSSDEMLKASQAGRLYHELGER